MPHINPQQLKHWRTKRSLSMEELGDAASVNKSTIYRIEKAPPPRRSVRPSILRALAKGLDVKEEQLADEAEPAADMPRREPPDRSQVSFKLDISTRNALAFVSRRYRINPTTIIDLAPLLFVMVAEDSLRKRAERLSTLHAARLGSGTLPSAYTDSAQRFEEDEARSIRARDIFGLQLDHADIQPPRLPKGVDPVGQWNPFEHHVTEWFKQSGEAGGIVDWICGPAYHVCREAALAFASGDEGLATALQEGWVGVHEVPADLRGSDTAELRLQWLRARVAAVKAQREDAERVMEAEIKDVLASLALEPVTTPHCEEENQ